MRFLLFILISCVSLSVRGNDSLSCSGKFDKQGKRIGVWVCRNGEGKLVRKERYRHGALSTWMIYNSKGQMIESRDRKGRVKKYYPCGC